MKKTNTLFILLFLFQITNAQSEFKIMGSNSNSEQISFKLINNLIVIPIQINGDKLSFILDTGVNKTILFNLSENDSVALLNTKKIRLRGLGKGEAVDALLSKNNTFKIKNIVSNNESLYVILKDYFDLSSKMGTTIHGIIGYNLLKDFVVKINYKTKKLDFYNPKTYAYNKCKKCETFPLQFYRKKPFVDVQVQLDTIGNKTIDVKMLIDAGGSDALWLFENSKVAIKTPTRYFNDILGEGLSGAIFGNRSRIPKFKMGKFEIENPTVSFLDSASTHNARKFKQRNGSIGGNILKRFKVWIDYPNKKLTLKKNGSFSRGFNYNMSGLDVVYHGKQLVKEKVSQKYKTPYDREINNRNSVSFVTKYAFNFKPTYIIRKVVDDSPADKVGLQKGDIIIKINGKPSHEFTLADIISRFQEKDKKKVRITVNRNSEKIKFEFRLEKKI